MNEVMHLMESDFESYLQQHNVTNELESIVNHPNFESMINGFTNTHANGLVSQMQSECEAFTNHIQSNIPVNSNYESIKKVIDSYHPIHFEDFGGFLKKKLKSVVKKGLNVAKGAIKKAASFAKNVALKPLLKLMNNALGFIKNNIKKLVTMLLKRVIRGLPQPVQPYILSAAKKIGIAAEYQSPNTEGEVRSLEMLNELDSEMESEEENFSLNSEEELDSEYETFSQGESYIGETIRQFDKEFYMFAESELNHLNLVNAEGEAEGYQNYTPEAEGYQNYTPEAEGYQNYTPEAEGYQNYTPEAEGYHQQTSMEFNSLEVNQARERFIQGITSNPSNFQPEFEQLAPVLVAARVAMKIPFIRNKVLNLMAGLMQKLFGKWIPESIGKLAYRPLSNLLLKAMTLEAANEVPYMRGRIASESLANVVTESVIAASHLPQSILEGDQIALEGELEEIIKRAMINNLPSQVLPKNFSKSSQLRSGLYFIPRKGGYSSLNRRIKVKLSPTQINGIRISRGALLSDFLRQYYKWDGNSSVSIRVKVYQSKSGITRISRIAKANLGGNKRFFLNQLHPMTRRFAFAIGLPWLYSKGLPRWYSLRLISSVQPNQEVKPISPISNNKKIRGNNISVKLDELDRFRVAFYLNNETLKKLRSAVGVKSFQELKKLCNDLLMSYGKGWLRRLFGRLKIPSIIAKRVTNWLLKLIIKYINKSAGKLIAKIGRLAFQSRGCTIEFVLNLPKGFTKAIRKITLIKIPGLIKSLAASKIQIFGHPGFRM
jgi:hypothetical protein